ncbi:MAG TPA: metal ABC transporter permease [Elusimicrobiota bacterium]|jgi:ABC-type Mn2+/Zn2+ transport system permease subunit|nr:metal ABC transporter permease [Elusimicrobiota bacterium]
MTAVDPASLAMAAAMAAAAGLIGCFAVMRRMTLAADALSHVALPGIGIALLLRVNPIFGAVAALFLGTLLIWSLERRTSFSTEAVIGVVFSAALALGTLLATGEELIAALLGEPGALSRWELAVGLAAAAAVIAFVLRSKDRLVVALVSPDIARTAGIDAERLNLLYLLAFSLTVALGLRFLGALLMGALVIIPAVAAKRLASSLRGMLGASVAISVFSTLAGTVLAARLHRETGPLIVLTAAACFFLSLLRKKL